MSDHPTPVLKLIKNRPVTSSADIAAYFGKRHDNVLRQIRQIIDSCPTDFRALNFEETFIDVIGPNGAVRKEPAFSLTKDGFTLLAMGFTGPKAMQFKVAYIEAFNAMEAELAAPKALPKPKAAPKTKPKALPAPEPQPKRAQAQTVDLGDILFKAKIRALENTKKINQIYRDLDELDSRCFEDYRMLNRAEQAFRGYGV